MIWVLDISCNFQVNSQGQALSLRWTDDPAWPFFTWHSAALVVEISGYHCFIPMGYHRHNGLCWLKFWGKGFWIGRTNWWSLSSEIMPVHWTSHRMLEKFWTLFERLWTQQAEPCTQNSWCHCLQSFELPIPHTWQTVYMKTDQMHFIYHRNQAEYHS